VENYEQKLKLMVPLDQYEKQTDELQKA